jgi:hypothetical protein
MALRFLLELVESQEQSKYDIRCEVPLLPMIGYQEDELPYINVGQY